MTLSAKQTKYNLPEGFLQMQSELLPLRPIHNNKDYEKALDVLEFISAFKLNKAQKEYFEVLSDNIGKYEESRLSEQWKHTEPLDVLKFLLEENGLKAGDLAEILGLNKTYVYKILSGQRNLSKKNAQKLAERFGVQVSLFL